MFRKIIVANQRYIMRKLSLKFQKITFNISCKIESLNKPKWLNKIIHFHFLETKTINKLSSRNSILSIISKFICDYLYTAIIYKNIFTTGTSH